MDFALTGYIIFMVHRVTFITLFLILLILTSSYILKSKLLGQLAMKLEQLVLGFFGLFKCENKPLNYSYLGIELESNLATAACFSIGLWLVSWYAAFIAYLIVLNLASTFTIVCIGLSYLCYPALMYTIRKKFI